MTEKLLVERRSKQEDTVIRVGNVLIGGENPPVIIAGPCSVESKSQIMAAARGVKSAGAHILRGGTYKPRTSPYSFQGLGMVGLDYLQTAGREVGMPVITEALGESHVEQIAATADVIQIGSRNGKAYELLRKVGEIAAATNKPVLLKRQECATVDEYVQAAEYIAYNGCSDIILCLRGIRTFEAKSRRRYTADICSIVELKERTHLPVLFDPSHACGRREYIESLSLAAIAAGADGLMIESHPQPAEALSDAAQQIVPAQLAGVIEKVNTLYQTLYDSACHNGHLGKERFADPFELEW